MAQRARAVALALGPWLAGGALLILAARLGLPLCPAASLFGIPCPGCGLTRAALALARGELQAALRYHPLVLVALPLLLFLVVQSVLPAFSGSATAHKVRVLLDRLLLAKRARFGIALLFVAFLVVWGLRFAGYFGGPVPVETLEHWLHAVGIKRAHAAP